MGATCSDSSTSAGGVQVGYTSDAVSPSEAVSIEAQGHVFKFHCRGQRVGGGGRRGRVIGFSAASRKRLLEKMARLDVSEDRPLFITLTYPAEFPNCEVARRHRRVLEKRLGRRFPGLCWVWRLELQKRGAPHFHLLAWGVRFLPVGELRSMWAAVIGYSGIAPLQVHVTNLRSWRGVLSYVSKYMGKVQDAGGMAATYLEAGELQKSTESAGDGLGSGLLDYGAYLPALFGRVWGVWRSELLPWGRLVVFRCEYGSWVHQVRRYARRAWVGVRRGPGGFMLFRDNPYRWFDCAGVTWAG